MKPLTLRQREEVARVARSLGIDGDADAILRQAISAGVKGKISREISAITSAAGITWLAPAVWIQQTEENELTAVTAREILSVASSMEVFRGPIPSDDKMAVTEVTALIALAQQAWDSGIQNEQTKTILGMAEQAEVNGEVQVTEAEGPAKEVASEEPEVEENKVVEEDKNEEEEVSTEVEEKAPEPVTQEQEYPKEVQEALDVLKQEAESAKRERVPYSTPVTSAHLRKKGKGSVPLPFDNYDKMYVPDIKLKIGEAVKRYRHNYDEKALSAFFRSIINYENSLVRPRKGLIRYVEDARDFNLKGKVSKREAKSHSPRKEVQGPEAQGPSEEVEHEEIPKVEERSERQREDSTASEVDATGKDSAKGGEEDREAPSEGEVDLPRVDITKEEVIAENTEEQVDLLVTGVQQEYKSKRLHTPEFPEEKPAKLPFDLTKLSDAQLRSAHNDYAAYAYRAGYLLGMEEVSLLAAKEEYDREHARQLVDIDKQDFNGRAKLASVIEAEIEQNKSVQVLMKKRNYHAMRVTTLKSEREQYSRMVEVVSRQATMRADEWEKERPFRGK